MQVPELNVQSQTRVVWPNKLVVAKAYTDQLERSKALAADRVSALRKAIKQAESSKLSKKSKTELAKIAASLEADAGKLSGTDASRMRALAEVLKQPIL